MDGRERNEELFRLGLDQAVLGSIPGSALEEQPIDVHAVFRFGSDIIALLLQHVEGEVDGDLDGSDVEGLKVRIAFMQISKIDL